jgi:hypothetical protein
MNSALRRALASLRTVRLVGRISACFCTLAVLLLADGLQALMRNDFNHVDLPLGGQVLISGAMPLHAKDHTDVIASIEGHDGISFTLLTSFKGLGFGAHMWRAALDVDAASAPGTAVLTVLDLVPAKNAATNATITVQNPYQIYTITVWASEKAMQAAHLSFSRRLTGISAFLTAALSAACGIALGALNIFLHLAAHKALAKEGIFAVHGRKKTDAGYQAIFDPAGADSFLQTQQPMSLLSPDGVEQNAGVLIECSRLKGSALFPLDGAHPRFGWLLRYEPDASAAAEREKDST